LFSIQAVRPIVDICAQFDIKAVFFVSVYEHCKFDKKTIAEAVQYLADKGHDVQLHTHPYWCYGRDYLRQFSLAKQTEIIAYGRDLLFEWLGRYPIAHRAGAYGINQETIKALRANNIPIDSSMYYQHRNCKLCWSKNRIVEKKGIIEIPLTGIYRQHHLSLANFKIKYRQKFIKTDIDWCSPEELIHFVRAAKANDIKIMNLFLHSYSLLRFDPRSGEVADDPKKCHNLQQFLQTCINDHNVRFITMPQFQELYHRKPREFIGSDMVPVVSRQLNTSDYIRSRLKSLVKNAANS
jgi:peptidoglycan/xylan/chitin deacetylase (PgdA/CDA1 family)